MSSLYDQVVSAHRRTLDRLIDRGAAERLKKVYEKAAAEVLAKLERLGRGSSTFTAHHLRLALAHPQWGFTLEEVKQGGLDIIVAIDTSRSMLARDLRQWHQP